MENFRCFKDLCIEFKPGINLLVGDNASGKTSILRACKYALSSFFAGFSDENTRWLAPQKNDFHYQITNGVGHPNNEIRITYTAQFEDALHELLTISKNSPKSSRQKSSGIAGYKRYAADLAQTFFSVHGQCKSLPLFANYTTEDIHTSRRIQKNRFINYHPKSSFGYYECLDGDGFYEYWKKRILTLQEREKNLIEITIVREALIKALGRGGCDFLLDMQVSNEKRCIYYTFIDGRESDDENLSDGYKRLINIVTDIAFRCTLLNRDLYEKLACERTEGTVLIDEVDLHLHPSLQLKILPSLRRAFPNIQFIVTSHAPMVMTSVESNEENIVYKLSYNEMLNEYSADEIDTYGMDSSLILSARLELTERNSETQKQLDRLNQLIEDEKIGYAKKLLAMMQEQYGQKIPELAGAETEIFIAEDQDALDS